MPNRAYVAWVSRWLPRRSRSLEIRRLGWLAARLRRHYDAYPGDVDTVLHGFPAVINAGNPYPFLVERFPLFNRALVDLVRAVSVARKRPLTLVDVGAAIGDTVLLVQSQAPRALGEIHCIEPAARFIKILRANTARFAGVHLHEQLVTRDGRPIRALVHNHAGTATATGEAWVPSTTLDQLLLPSAKAVDVLKIDIDGSDGEALAGAAGILRRDQPGVIFEWHPILARQAGNDPFAAFATLREAGYERLLWFRNDGPFSHFSTPDDPEIRRWEKYLVRMQPFGDPHFDIVALPPSLAHLAETVASQGVLPAIP